MQSGGPHCIGSHRGLSKPRSFCNASFAKCKNNPKIPWSYFSFPSPTLPPRCFRFNSRPTIKCNKRLSYKSNKSYASSQQHVPITCGGRRKLCAFGRIAGPGGEQQNTFHLESNLFLRHDLHSSLSSCISLRWREGKHHDLLHCCRFRRVAIVELTQTPHPLLFAQMN